MVGNVKAIKEVYVVDDTMELLLYLEKSQYLVRKKIKQYTV